MAKYINPFTDWGFKRLFGQEFSKGLLISFLNDLLEGELKVKDVTFHDKGRGYAPSTTAAGPSPDSERNRRHWKLPNSTSSSPCTPSAS